MAKKKLKKFWRIYWTVLLLFLLMTSLIIGDSAAAKILSFVTMIVEIIAVIIISTIIHELGHLFFGLIFKYRFISFSVLFFNFSMENDKVKFRFCMPKAFAGYCMMIPRYNPISKFLWFIAGGIIFNLISGILFFYAYKASDNTASFYLILFIVSISVALINALPAKKDLSNSTDGWKIRTILFKKDELEDFIKAAKLNDLTMEGQRPRDYDITFDKTKEYDTSHYIAIFFKAIDSGDIETAIHCSNKIEGNFDAHNEVTFLRFCYIICYTSCITGDIEKAKVYYDKCRKRAEKDNDCNGYRVRAYYEYYANNNIEYAYELCQKGLDVVDKFVLKGHAKMEKDLMEKLQDEIKNAKT